MTSYIKNAQNVIGLEIKGLEKLAKMLGDAESPLSKNFNASIDMIKACEGRVIVTGIGKSGHIGRKIAATLTSTGEPASFVHPGEASHGDLGMISTRDVVLAISNSGDTAELASIITYCARFNIKLIGISSNSDSTLGRNANIILELPKANEACGETRAPTTSTTMTLALGDAIAVALLRDKGFKADDFKRYHPGGKLGAGLRKVSDLTAAQSNLPLAKPHTRLSDITNIITSNNYGCVGIVEGEKLIGVITDGDIRRHLSPDIYEKQAKDVMTKNPIIVKPDTLAADALALMSDKRITALFVIDDSRPIGLIHIQDFMTNGVI